MKDETVYFSVDVETSGPCPGMGQLLSVGVDIVFPDDRHFGRFHETIWRSPFIWHEDTKAWWEQQTSQVFLAATSDGLPEYIVAEKLQNFVTNACPEPKDRCFVAHPACFDWPWINDLFLKNVGHNPFGHRALCLRSMLYGMRDIPWNSERETWEKYDVPSQLPHHALYDAMAQAKQLRLFLENRARLLELPE